MHFVRLGRRHARQFVHIYVGRLGNTVACDNQKSYHKRFQNVLRATNFQNFGPEERDKKNFRPFGYASVVSLPKISVADSRKFEKISWNINKTEEKKYENILHVAWHFAE